MSTGLPYANMPLSSGPGLPAPGACLVRLSHSRFGSRGVRVRPGYALFLGKANPGPRRKKRLLGAQGERTPFFIRFLGPMKTRGAWCLKLLKSEFESLKALPFSDFDSGQSYISFITHRDEAILSTYRVVLGLNKMNEIILPIHPRHSINPHRFIQMSRSCLAF